MNEPKIVTLCGSTRFKDEFLKAQKDFTLKGYIVLTVGCYPHTDKDDLTEEQKRAVDELHLRKIDMSHMVYVINKGGYIGDSTKREILYAQCIGVKVFFLEELPEPIDLFTSSN
ncbi:TPA_asm: hypothetical protein vir519_00049 [Caudoviricetes sp. vir519]|nr:TPA_asm: hypothetical protein vir519_00049 [Caudoviricetes sp. vir519]